MTHFAHFKTANLGLACESARKWVEERRGLADPVCQVANFLYTGAKVIAGHDEVCETGNERGGARYNRLEVFLYLW